VGAVVGLLLAVLLFLGVVLLLVFIMYRRRSSARRGVKEGEITENTRAVTDALDNPVYSGRDSEPAREGGGADTHQYHILSPPPTTSTGGTAANSSQVYAVPDNVPPSNGGSRKKPNAAFDNPEYYSAIQDVHSTTDDQSWNATMVRSCQICFYCL
jgi:hypothetical protein